MRTVILNFISGKGTTKFSTKYMFDQQHLENTFF